MLRRIRTWLSGLFGRLHRPRAEIRRILAEMEVNKGRFAEEAVTAAVEHRKEIAPHLIEVIRKTTRDATRGVHGPDYIAHLYAMYLLAQFREHRAYEPIVELLRLPGSLTEDLLGDTVTEGADRILASVSGVDMGPLKKLIEDADANEWARGAGAQAMMVMALEGLVPREQVIDYFRNLLRGGLERKPSAVWDGLVGCAADLHASEIMDDIRKAFEEGLIDEGVISQEDVKGDLKRDREKWLEEQRKRAKGLIDDTAAEMSWWHCFHAEEEEDDTWDDEEEPEYGSYSDEPSEPFVRSEEKVGRNDPCPCGSGKKYKKCCLAAPKT